MAGSVTVLHTVAAVSSTSSVLINITKYVRRYQNPIHVLSLREGVQKGVQKKGKSFAIPGGVMAILFFWGLKKGQKKA